MTPVDYRIQTTLITGASAGIGEEFARRLAARGSALVLVARRADRLEKLAADIEAAHRVRVTVIPMDLSAPAAGSRLKAETDRLGLRVTGLINNAGFGTHGPFQDEDPARLRDEIAVNIAALVDLTRAYVGDLRAADSGVLVNLASLAAYQPIPKMAVYAASKAFVLNFTEALWYEARGTGLRVTCLSPGATSTEFFDVLGSEADGGTPRQTAADVVTTALRALDRRTPPPSVVSGRLNRLLASGSRLLPRRAALLAAATRA